MKSTKENSHPPQRHWKILRLLSPFYKSKSLLAQRIGCHKQKRYDHVNAPKIVAESVFWKNIFKWFAGRSPGAQSNSLEAKFRCFWIILWQEMVEQHSNSPKSFHYSRIEFSWIHPKFTQNEATTTYNVNRFWFQLFLTSTKQGVRDRFSLKKLPFLLIIFYCRLFGICKSRISYTGH